MSCQCADPADKLRPSGGPILAAVPQQPEAEQQFEARDRRTSGGRAKHHGADEQCDQGGGLHGSIYGGLLCGSHHPGVREHTQSHPGEGAPGEIRLVAEPFPSGSRLLDTAEAGHAAAMGLTDARRQDVRPHLFLQYAGLRHVARSRPEIHHDDLLHLQSSGASRLLAHVPVHLQPLLGHAHIRQYVRDAQLCQRGGPVVGQRAVPGGLPQRGRLLQPDERALQSGHESGGDVLGCVGSHYDTIGLCVHPVSGYPA
ncbi:uncharacterized protein LOC108144161 isoform X2 [Drosophila elegans]|uniref:uncharacterized protein LOC108144161 isoform X2 n=1 Tax=Drosophila elegans TaxID=30023 RepID=UPI0007E6412F|nr:uncharacterized protein LOC108144161 isoform X2 [Drosophila elegans]